MPNFPIKAIALFILSQIFSNTCQAGLSVVAGTMKNAYLNDRIELRVPQYFIDGKSNSGFSFIGSENEFFINIDIEEPQMAFLIHNEDRLPIYLEPNDTLFIETDVFQFPLVVSYSGKAAHNNRLLKQFLQENPNDFNEFNNLRYKVGNWWTTIESDMDNNMNNLGIEEYKLFLEKRKMQGIGLLDDYNNRFPGKITTDFNNFLAAEILYNWSYHMLIYGTIYKVKHQIDESFFEFQYEVPISNEQVGSPNYRQYLMTMLSHKAQQQNAKTNSGVFKIQYDMSGELLNGKALAFYRSEIIMIALKDEKFNEAMSVYRDFLQNNKHLSYDFKITDLYEKAVKFSPGTMAPEFSAADPYSTHVRLSDFRGKVVYINFWASWCGACLKKMNYFNDSASELQSKGVVIVNVSIDENAESWRNAMSSNIPKGHNILASTDANRNIGAAYNVEAVPAYFIIGKYGTFEEKSFSNKPEDVKKRLLELAEGNRN